MGSSTLACAVWRKSSRSNHGGNGNCVEFTALSHQIGLRDSKNPTGPVLVVPHHEWQAFLQEMRSDQFSNSS